MADGNNAIWVNRDGLFDSGGLIDTIISDCNASIGELASGQRIVWCATMVEIVQKLGELKKGVDEERDQMQKQIDELRRLNDELASQLYTNNEAKEAGDHV